MLKALKRAVQGRNYPVRVLRIVPRNDGDGYRMEENRATRMTNEEGEEYYQFLDYDKDMQAIDFDSLFSVKRWSWKKMRKVRVDYAIVFESDKGVFDLAEIDVDKKMLEIASQIKTRQRWQQQKAKSTREAWDERSRMERLLPYIGLIVVAVFIAIVIGSFTMFMKDTTQQMVDAANIMSNAAESIEKSR